MGIPAKHYRNPNRINQQGKRERLLKERGSICEVCGFPGYVELHHKERVIDGGSSDDDNLIFLCQICNAKAHKMTQRKFVDMRVLDWKR